MFMMMVKNMVYRTAWVLESNPSQYYIHWVIFKDLQVSDAIFSDNGSPTYMLKKISLKLIFRWI